MESIMHFKHQRTLQSQIETKQRGAGKNKHLLLFQKNVVMKCVHKYNQTDKNLLRIKFLGYNPRTGPYESKTPQLLKSAQILLMLP